MRRRFLWFVVVGLLCLTATALVVWATSSSKSPHQYYLGASSPGHVSTVAVAPEANVSATGSTPKEVYPAPVEEALLGAGLGVAPEVEPELQGVMAVPAPAIEVVLGDESGRGVRMPLDVRCSINNTDSTGGWISTGMWDVGHRIKVWVDPRRCSANPYPFKVDTIRVAIYFPANGTFTWAVDLECPTLPNDTCSGPRLDTLVYDAWQYTRSTGPGGAWFALPLNAPAGFCVSGPFFVGFQFISWTGSPTSRPSLYWDRRGRYGIYPPRCTQWRCTPTCTDWNTVVGTDSIKGNFLVRVLGNTNDGCTPVVCTACDVVCQAGDSLECAENPADTTFYRTDCNGGCNNTVPSFQNITCGRTVCGRSFTYVGPGGSNYRDTDWYLFTVTAPETITVEVRAEFSVLAGIVRNVQPCNSPSFVVSGTQTIPCSLLTVTANCLEPGTYALFVAPAVFTGISTPLEYRARLWCRGFCAQCVPDYVLTAPGSWTSTTCGAGDDCTLRTGQDRIVQVNIPQTGQWTFSLCGSAAPGWDSYIYLTTQCCGGTTITANDDGCGYPPGLSEIVCQQLTAGTYYLDIEPYSGGVCGPFTLVVSQCAPCSVVCQQGDVIECAENTDSTHADLDCNGGCNSLTPNYQALQCGQTVCGRTFTYLGPGGTNYRDTDWYQVTIPSRSILYWTVTSETPVNLIIADATDCENIILLASGTLTRPCDTVTVATDCLPAGTYVAWVGPTAFTGVPLSDYRGVLTCVSCEPCDVVQQPGDIPENEPPCYDGYTDQYNGGCNSTPRVFAPTLTCGQAVFGTAGTFVTGGSNYRDTDWFAFTVTQPETIQYCAVAEFPFLTFVLGPGPQGYECDSLRFYSDAGLGGSCDTVCLTVPCLTPGTYWLFMAPQTFSGVPCSLQYRAWVNCTVCCDTSLRAHSVTVYRVLNSVEVRFMPPQSGSYAIYSTTDRTIGWPNPSWTQEAVVTATAGDQYVWTDPAGLVAYKRYLVIHLCP